MLGEGPDGLTERCEDVEDSVPTLALSMSIRCRCSLRASSSAASVMSSGLGGRCRDANKSSADELAGGPWGSDVLASSGAEAANFGSAA